MIWVLWNNRNDSIWNNERSGGTRLGMQELHIWQDLFQAQKVHDNGNIDHNYQTV